ncbi:hypothetical protein [Sinorhizobium chiapasense]|uniref:AlgX/AlgJ SGNH hydrolase-like domain-containing protein n=1 Tax=Sinorhizobium chiapasense TaxID=501572 RepID=A0ABZ2BHQ2_9HYPH
MFGLLALEGLCRVLPVMSGWENPPVTADHPFIRNQPFNEYVFSQGWDLRGVVRGRFNSLGFSSPEPERDTKLVIIGDSFVEASMLNFDERLAPLINKKQSDLRATSLGRAGADIPDYIVTANWVQRHLKSSFIVFVITDGDLLDSLRPKRRGYWFSREPDGSLALRRDTESGLRNALLKSRFASYVLYNLKFGPSMIFSGSRRGEEAALQSEPESGALENAVERFLDEIAALQRSGIKVVLAFDAERGAIYTGRGKLHTKEFDLLAGRAATQGIAICDLSSAFATKYALSRQPFDFVNGEGHWNALGSSVVADAVLGTVKSLKVQGNEVSARVPDRSWIGSADDPGKRQ